jgi:hypothetical protein
MVAFIPMGNIGCQQLPLQIGFTIIMANPLITALLALQQQLETLPPY